MRLEVRKSLSLPFQVLEWPASVLLLTRRCLKSLRLHNVRHPLGMGRHLVWLIRGRRWLRLLIPLIFVQVSPVAATTVGLEFQLFKSLCVVVEIPDSDIEPIDRRGVEELTFDAIQERLRESGLAFPIEHGRQCFPGKVGSAPDQLSLRFNAVLARDPENPSLVILSLTAHDFFRDFPRSPFAYPTKILWCKRDDQLSFCVAHHISEFFGETTLKTILRAHELLRGRMQ